MNELVCTLISLCAVGFCTSTPVNTTVRLVKEGQNVSLPCDLTHSSESYWYRFRSEELLLVLGGEMFSNLDNVSVAIYNIEPERFKAARNVSSGSVAIEITSLKEKDLGIYLCADRTHGILKFGKGIHLAFEGKFPVPIYTHEGDPCWFPLACVAPASALLSGLVVWALCFQKGGSISLCSGCLKGDSNLKEMSLHYASLSHIARPCPPIQGNLPLAEADVTYSTVGCRVNLGT